MPKQHYFVHGTSCKSCEVVIERELQKQPEISSVDVSHAHGRISIETNGDRMLTIEELNSILEKHHYSVSGSEEERKESKKKQQVNWKRAGAVLVLVFAAYLLLDNLGFLRFSPSSTAPAGFLGILGIGFIASLSSCTAVVGGLVAAVSSAIAKEQEGMSKKERFKPHVLFNIGRIAGFFLFGSAIGYAGSVLQLSPMLNGLFVIAVALLMIIIGVNLLELFPTPALGMPKWLAHKVHDLAESKDPKAPLILGAMTFFLPCGFTQSMQLVALSLQDPLQSGLVMAVFALGTAPVLLGIGGAASYASGQTLKKITRFAGAVVLILGLSNALNGLALIGITKDTVFGVGSHDNSMGYSIVQGRQQIEMRMTDRGLYMPDVLTVQEGVPVDWTIIGDDFMGCGDTLILPAFGINTTLKTGPNLVQFTPDKSGRFTFSCSMGMIRGTMVVTPAT